MIVTSSMPPLASDLESAVVEIWAAERALRPTLFNGRVFSVDRVTPSRIEGHWSEYRRIAARLRRPDLAAALVVRPLAVAGILETSHGIVIERRPSNAIYQPGLWQLAPAGNVDPNAAVGDGIDLIQALRLELAEELGLGDDEVTFGPPVCVVRHEDAGIVDVAIPLRSGLSEQAIRDAHTSRGDGEYPELEIVPRHSLRTFLAERANSVAPQVPHFLRAIGALP